MRGVHVAKFVKYISVKGEDRRMQVNIHVCKYGLLTKCEVKMAGYWPSSFFLRVYGPRRSQGPQTRKKRTRPISSHLDRTNLVNKGLAFGEILLAGYSGWSRAGKMAPSIWVIDQV